jgi:hypothetical protein
MPDTPYDAFDDDRWILDGEPADSRADAILARWELTRTGAGLDDGQEPFAAYLAELIDEHLPDDHDSIADVRATVAAHVDLDLFLDVSPETCARLIEQLTIAADDVVASEREIVIVPSDPWGDYVRDAFTPVEPEPWWQRWMDTLDNPLVVLAVWAVLFVPAMFVLAVSI